PGYRCRGSGTRFIGLHRSPEAREGYPGPEVGLKMDGPVAPCHDNYLLQSKACHLAPDLPVDPSRRTRALIRNKNGTKVRTGIRP
ncbi:MAG: hypothetical protein VYB54_05205, partial [Pseudomonadota bacterium]|nr:hypothetical protein [Pseudomonadota bacterium]